MRLLGWFAAVGLLVACSASGSGGRADPTKKPAGGSATALERAIAAECGSKHWVGAWRAAPSDAQHSFENQTLRMVIAPHLDGGTVRVRFSNRFGPAKLSVAAVTIGVRASGARIRPGTSKAVEFDGHRPVSIPAGARAVSDPVRVNVTATDELAVTMYLRTPTGPATEHLVASEIGTYVAAGDHVDNENGVVFGKPARTWYFLEGIDVLAPAGTGAVAAFGDSITDGYHSITAQADGEHNTRYPDFLARRLRVAKRPLAVLNLGISSNLLLADAPAGGRGGLARIDQDILGAPGVTDVLLLEGVNDIGRANAKADRVIAGLQQTIIQLQDRGLHVMVATLLPTAGSGVATFSDAAASQTRATVNAWIRKSGVPDAVVDFDAAVRDPTEPSRLNPRDDSGDHLHPNARGYKAMADAVDLRQLQGPACGR